MTPITPEELAELRAECSKNHLLPYAGVVILLLDALEEALARAEKAENDATAKKYELAHAGTLAKLIEAEERAENAEAEVKRLQGLYDLADEHRNRVVETGVALSSEVQRLTERAECAEAERDVLAGRMAGFCGVCPVAGTFEANNCPRPLEQCPPLIRSWAAQEAARRVSPVSDKPSSVTETAENETQGGK